MNRHSEDFDQKLDRVLDEVHREQPSTGAETSAAARVWARIEAELTERGRQTPREPHRIRDCADFQALLPAYLQSALNESKKLLLEDHISTCVTCRRVLKQSRGGRAGADVAAQRQRSWVSTWTFRLAAAAAIVVGLVGLSVKTDVFTLRTGGLIRIESADGEVYRVDENGSTPLAAGQTVSFEDAKWIRTGKGASAMLRLADDSRVEMSDRAEVSIHDQRKIWNADTDSVVEVQRGSVIVEVSPQGSGHFYVDTADASVEATGTVFAVNRGMKGSRITVIEGEVEVLHAGQTDVLMAGQQATTNPALARSPVTEEIAWSKQFEKHLALLEQFAELGREIDQQVDKPGTRYRTALLDRVPADTTVYVAIPNLSTTLSQAYDLMQQKISENALLREWWDDSVASTDAEAKIELAMSKIRSYGRQIGDEIVIAVSGIDREHEDPRVLIVAELTDPKGFEDQVRSDLNGLRLLQGDAGGSSIELLGDDLAGGTDGDLRVWVHEGFVAISPRLDTLRDWAATLARGGASDFYGTPFHERLAALYDKGVQWVIAVDVAAIRRDTAIDSTSATRGLEALGILDLQHVLGQYREFDGRGETRAELTFERPRRGVASWLAQPAAMGALDFVSRQAYFAAGFVMKEPVQVLDELLEFLGSEDSDFLEGLERFQHENAVDVREDIAAAIGGEFAFALDGPVLPKPSWKLVVEVYDPAKLQRTLEWAVGRLHDSLVEHGRQGVALETVEQGGRTYYELKSLDTGISAHYLFVDGYLIASASRALLDRALEVRDTGMSLASSPRFTALLPYDAEPNFSAVVYQDWGPIVRPLAQGLSRSPDVVGRTVLDKLGSLSGPSLTVAYGREQGITLVNTTEGGLLGRSLTSILSVQSLLSVQELVDRAVQDEADDRPAEQPSEREVRVKRSVTEG